MTLEDSALAYVRKNLFYVHTQVISLITNIPRPMHRTASFVYHYIRLQKNLRNYSAPLNPFKIISVPPSSVEQFTGRPYPPWQNFNELLGTVSSGDWDITPPTVNDTEYSGTPAYLYLGNSFSDSIVHKSLENHFIHNYPWQDTQIVRAALQLVNEPGFVWNCFSEEEIWDRCKGLDQLYNDVKKTGEFNLRLTEQEEGKLPRSVLEQMSRHIIVDIGRHGELLFVDGRHRLSIAKILGLDRVPVAVCVRHRKWMERRDQIYRSGEEVFHPDLGEWGGNKHYRSVPLYPIQLW